MKPSCPRASGGPGKGAVAADSPEASNLCAESRRSAVAVASFACIAGAAEDSVVGEPGAAARARVVERAAGSSGT